MAYRFSKVSDCIFEIDQLWQSGISRVYSNCCCSCSFEAEIIKIGQSSHKMYSNKILTFQESTTILNACTKKSGNILNSPRICTRTCTHTHTHTHTHIYIYIHIYTQTHIYIYSHTHKYIYTHAYIYIYTHMCIHTHIYTQNIYVRGSLNKFPDFFRMGTFIDSTQVKF